MGELQSATGGVTLLGLRLQKNDGHWSGEISVPDLKVLRSPLKAIAWDGEKLSFEWPLDHSRFECQVPDTELFSCTRHKRGRSSSADFEVIDHEEYLELAGSARPQNPVPPLPYASESFDLAVQGGTISAILTTPKSPHVKTAVVLLSGSGAQDEDSSIVGHRPFLVLADALTRSGITVLRLADRGVSGSTADAAAPLDELARDALAAISWLRERDDLELSHIGFLGHSQGAAVAIVAARAQPETVDFLISLGGPGVPMAELLMTQTESAMRRANAPAPKVAAKVKWYAKLLKTLRSEDADARRSDVIKLLEVDPGAASSGVPAQQAEALAHRMVDTPIFRSLAAFDPQPLLPGLDVPVLVLNGGLDTQVEPAANLAGFRAGLGASASPSWCVAELPGLNHLMQPATTGGVEEYATIETTIAPQVLTLVADWLLALESALPIAKLFDETVRFECGGRD